MITIQLLEDHDLICMDDWCRPLSMTYTGDYVYDTSNYGGLPENNMRWVKVNAVIGKCWKGKRIIEINQDGKYHTHPRYEFARGDIPEAHILPNEPFYGNE